MSLKKRTVAARVPAIYANDNYGRWRFRAKHPKLSIVDDRRFIPCYE